MANTPGTVRFPANLDDADSLIRVANVAGSTTVSDNPLTSGATTVNVASTTGFPATGLISIENEVISYTGTTATSFTGCARAADSTSAAAHASGVKVYAYHVALHHGTLRDALIAVETKVGSGSSTPTTGKVLLGNGAGTSAWTSQPLIGASVRVGSGSATVAALDGSDGLMMADGASGGLLFRDRVTSTNYGIWYETSGVFVLGSQAGNVWLVAPATGVITQAARTTLTAGTNITLGAAGWATPGSRIVVPDGYAEVQLTLKATAAISAGAVVAVVASGHRPPGIVGGTLNRLPLGVAANAVSVPFFVDTAGNVSLGNTTLANTDVLVGLIAYATI